jgi:8-oxo-dGTP pyrophosphatase MutT (NUDIX family)/GNAT superfamily N-acetyltransferase
LAAVLADGCPSTTDHSDYRRGNSLPEVGILTKSCNTEHGSTAYRGWVPDLIHQIRSAVATRVPVDARERDSVASFLRLFDALDRPLSEQANKVHVTASAILVTEDRRRVLLHLHKRLNLWLQPGGHIDEGETPWEAARREAAEETGLPTRLAGEFGEDGPSLLHVDVHAGPKGHTHLDLRYLVEAPHQAPTPPEGESQNVQWFHWHQAVDMADAGLEGVLRSLQPGDARIRVARHTDAVECAQVYLRSRAFALPTVPLVHADREVRRWMADEVVGRTDMWVAEVDGTIVALMVLDGGWIEHLYLDPSWMGRGLGDQLVQLAKERSSAGLQLWTFQVNEPARRFYERHGFVAEEFTEGAGNEERAPDVRYRWTP